MKLIWFRIHNFFWIRIRIRSIRIHITGKSVYCLIKQILFMIEPKEIRLIYEKKIFIYVKGYIPPPTLNINFSRRIKMQQPGLLRIFNPKKMKFYPVFLCVFLISFLSSSTPPPKSSFPIIPSGTTRKFADMNDLIIGKGSIQSR